jgi:alpha-galactosidase
MRIVFLLFLCVLAAPAASLTGTWAARVTASDGHVTETFFSFEQHGSDLTGKYVTSNGERPIKQGKVEGNNFTFVIEFGNPAAPRVVPWQGSISGSELHLTSSPPGRPALEMVAKPASPSALEPPKKLPLPLLQDVPWNKLSRTPPMGWNSWNKFQGSIDDKTVREIADAMVRTGMKDAGYHYLNIDDTWQGERDAQGNIHPNKKFPDMKALADYVHEKGLLFGLYSSPGPKTCAGYEGSYGHEAQDAQSYEDWTVDYLKYDWCSAGRIYSDTDMQAVYQKMGAALVKIARPVVFSLCQYGRDDVWTWGPKVSGNLWRTTGDIQDNWKSMSSIGFDQGRLAPFAGKGHWNDPDMLEVGNGGMTDDEYRTHMSLWSILAAPLLAGNDVRTMTQSVMNILLNKEVIQIDQDKLGKQGTRMSQDGDKEIWTKELDGGGVAVALFNRGETPAGITIKWADFTGGNQQTYVRDVWRHEFVKLTGDTWTATVPKHGVVLLRFSHLAKR